jgi:large subunit ribosomal protein L30
MAKVKITLVKSAIDRPKSQKATLEALGLTKLNRTIEKEVNPAVQGMINKVQHLLKVENI